MKKQNLALATIVLVSAASYLYVHFQIDPSTSNSGDSSELATIDSSFGSNLPDFPDTSEPEPTPEQPAPEQKPVESPPQTQTPVQTSPPATVAPATPTIPRTFRCTSGGSATSVTMSNQVIDLVNITRVANGLVALNCRDALIPLAEIRAQETVTLFSHTRPNGSPWYSLDPSIMNGENLAIGYGTAQTVFDAWMASPGHKANILRPEFRSMGIGYLYSDNMTDVPASLCQDRDGVPGNEETECDAVYHHHVAQIFSVVP